MPMAHQNSRWHCINSRLFVKNNFLLVSAFVFMHVLLGCPLVEAAIDVPQVINRKNLTDKLTVDDYTVEIYLDRKHQTNGVLRVLKGRDIVFQEQDHRYELGTNDDYGKPRLLNGARDITGDGIKDVVVTNYSGGAHCCYTYKVFSLGSEFSQIADLAVQDAGASVFEDKDGDGIYEFVTWDMTFAYWNASFAWSPSPQAILRFKDGRYTLAYDLMTKPLPTLEEEQTSLIQDEEEIKSLCSNDIWSWRKGNMCVTPDIWGHMLDLIYSGHPDAAWTFLDRWWKGSQEEKEWFIYDFKSRLVSSPYVQDMPVDLFGFDAVATDRWGDYFKRISDQLKEGSQQ